MKLLTSLFATVALVASASFAGEVADISTADLKKAIEEKSVVVIDVNGSDSYKEGHIPTALNFDEVEKDLASKLPADKNTLIVAYCGGPRCSAYKAAASAATKLGYTNVKHYSKGISGWKAEGQKTASAK